MSGSQVFCVAKKHLTFVPTKTNKINVFWPKIRTGSENDAWFAKFLAFRQRTNSRKCGRVGEYARISVGIGSVFEWRLGWRLRKGDEYIFSLFSAIMWQTLLFLNASIKYELLGYLKKASIKKKLIIPQKNVGFLCVVNTYFLSTLFFFCTLNIWKGLIWTLRFWES